MVLVAVLGAGVVGLTTALKVLELGHQVVVIAELFPGDEKSIRYTSNWAGANHMSMAAPDDKRQQKLDLETFHILWKMSEPGASTEKLFLRVPMYMFYAEERKQEGIHPLDYLPDFRWLKPSEMRQDSKAGVGFSTITIDIWRYLPYLYSQVILKGGKVVRAQVQHVDQVLSGSWSAVPDALIVCAGIGARLLGGVEDKNVYPIRGQSVLIRAPWIKFGMGGQSSLREDHPGMSAHLMPRGPSGDIFLGGTWFHNDWTPKARPEIRKIILEGALALCPEIAPPEVLASGRKPTLADVEPLVIEDGNGLRPGRIGGIRLERDIFEAGGKKVPVVYNYGHGGQGYQSSWGSAAMAVELLKEGLLDVTQNGVNGLKI